MSVNAAWCSPRRRRQVMEDVVRELERRHGSVFTYLLAAGVSPAALHGLHRAAARRRDQPNVNE